MNAPKHLTVRGVSTDLARALKAEARRRRTSLNETIKDLLGRALGVRPQQKYDNGLASLAGTWSKNDLSQFERATACFEAVDEELWK